MSAKRSCVAAQKWLVNVLARAAENVSPRPYWRARPCASRKAATKASVSADGAFAPRPTLPPGVMRLAVVDFRQSVAGDARYVQVGDDPAELLFGKDDAGRDKGGQAQAVGFGQLRAGSPPPWKLSSK